MNTKNPPLIVGMLLAGIFCASEAAAQGGKSKGQSSSKPSGKDKDSGNAKKPEPKVDLVEVDGEWYTKDEKAKLDKGWKRLDFDWIAPEEAPNIEKGLFKVNKAWVTEAQADEYHSKEGQPWEIPTKHFRVVSGVPRKQLLELAKHAEETWDLLGRTMGAEPKMEPRKRFKLVIFDSVDAGNQFASQAQSDSAHHTSVFPGYVADWDEDKPAVAVFDGEKGKSLGLTPNYTAHAVAHKYLEEVIPDVEKAPEWLIEGLAGFSDRYCAPYLKKWAIENLVRRGGIPKLDKFAKRFALSADDPDASQTKIHAAALIIAYYASTTDKADEAAFKKAMASLKKPKDRDAAIEALLDKPDDLEKKLKKFAEL
jgi:hypothetical protein